MFETIFLYGLTAVLLTVSISRSREKTGQALKKAARALWGIVPQLISILILIAVALSFADAVLISRLIGEESGVSGFLGAAVAGSITLMPGFVAFVMAADLLELGAGILPVAAFVSTLMMVGVVTFPMEREYFGARTALIRNSAAFVFSLVSAGFVALVVSL
ncbi:permease [Spirochaeta dissipatitropha]